MFLGHFASLFSFFYCIMQKKNYLAGFSVRLGGFLIKTNVCLFCHTKLETKQIDTKTDGQANCIFYIQMCYCNSFGVLFQILFITDHSIGSITMHKLVNELHFLHKLVNELHFLHKLVNKLHFLHKLVNKLHFLHKLVNELHFLHNLVNVLHFLHKLVNELHFLHKLVNELHFLELQGVHYPHQWGSNPGLPMWSPIHFLVGGKFS